MDKELKREILDFISKKKIKKKLTQESYDFVNDKIKKMHNLKKEELKNKKMIDQIKEKKNYFHEILSNLVQKNKNSYILMNPYLLKKNYRIANYIYNKMFIPSEQTKENHIFQKSKLNFLLNNPLILFHKNYNTYKKINEETLDLLLNKIKNGNGKILLDKIPSDFVHLPLIHVIAYCLEKTINEITMYKKSTFGFQLLHKKKDIKPLIPKIKQIFDDLIKNEKNVNLPKNSNKSSDNKIDHNNSILQLSSINNSDFNYDLKDNLELMIVDVENELQNIDVKILSSLGTDVFEKYLSCLQKIQEINDVLSKNKKKQMDIKKDLNEYLLNFIDEKQLPHVQLKHQNKLDNQKYMLKKKKKSKFRKKCLTKNHIKDCLVDTIDSAFKNLGLLNNIQYNEHNFENLLNSNFFDNYISLLKLKMKLKEKELNVNEQKKECKYEFTISCGKKK